MAAIDDIAENTTVNTDTTVGKRKRVSETGDGQEALVNGHVEFNSEKAVIALHDLLQDLLEVLQEYDIATTILTTEIYSTSIPERTPKRAKVLSNSKTSTIQSLVSSGSYSTVDNFWDDLKTAIHSTRDQAKALDQQKIAKLEDEVLAILTNEIKTSRIQLPRSANGDLLASNAEGDEISLATDKDLLLTTPAFVYSATQAPKRLYSSFRLSSNDDGKTLRALPLHKLPNNITATTAKNDKIVEQAEKVLTLKDILQGSKHIRLEPPRLSTKLPNKTSEITWTKQSEMKDWGRPRQRRSSQEQGLTIGQWLNYNNASSTSEVPLVEAKRRIRDRTLSTVEADIELTAADMEAILHSRQRHQKAKNDSLFKSLYSSFAPTHDNSGAIVPKAIRSRHWWLRNGAARYFQDSALQDAAPFSNETQSEATEDAPEVDESEISEMLDTWIDPELLNEMPKESNQADKDTQDLLYEISDMLQMLSSYQRNRSISLAQDREVSSSQKETLLELLGDSSTPSSSEALLYETLRDSLASVISSLPPYAVAKLNGEQLGELNISTKMLAQETIITGTEIPFEAPKQPQPVAQPVTRPSATPMPTRVSQVPQASTPTPTANPNLARPSASLYTKYRPLPTPGSYQGGTTQQHQQQQASSRLSYSQQTPAGTSTPLTNGTRATVNGYSSYGSQVSPQRPPSSSAPRANMSSGQTYSNYNAAAVNANAARSASPQVGHAAGVGQSQNWSPANGTIGSMFSAEEVSRLEQRQKTQMAAQAAQINQGSSTPRPPSRAMSSVSNGTTGR